MSDSLREIVCGILAVALMSFFCALMFLVVRGPRKRNARTVRTYWLVHHNAYGTTYAQAVPTKQWAEETAKALPNRVVAITGPYTVEFTEGDGL